MLFLENTLRNNNNNSIVNVLNMVFFNGYVHVMLFIMETQAKRQTSLGHAYVSKEQKLNFHKRYDEYLNCNNIVQL